MLCGSALVEYVFPPFPGDMLTVFGGVLVGAYQWSFVLVFASVTMGSVLGGLMTFALGRRLQKRRAPELSKGTSRLARLVNRFGKHGTIYVLLNRFLPGVRPLLFVAAGLAGMSTTRVFILSSISAAFWNALLIFAGMSVGNNLAQIEYWLKTYSLVVWALLLLIALLWIARRLYRGRRSAEEDAEEVAENVAQE